MDNLTFMVVLLVAGFLMIGAEIFVPGAVLGTLGVGSLLAAIVVAFQVSETVGFYVAIGVVVMGGITVGLWIKFFPRSSIGRKMTLSQDGSAFKSAKGRSELQGKEGIAASDLRPAGFAAIDGQRMDVVAEGKLIPKGERIKIVQVTGNRIVVRKIGE